MPEPARSGDIQAIVRASEILRLVCERSTINVQDVCAFAGLDRTTAHRYLSTLQSVGFLTRDGKERGAGYRLGPFASIISSAVLSGQNAIAAAAEALPEIAVHTGDTALVSVVNGRDVVVADVAHPSAARISIRIAIGYRVPADGIQAIVALAFEPDATIHSILADRTPDEQRAMMETIEQIRVDGGLIRTDTGGVKVVAVPIFEDSRVIATLATLTFPGKDERDRDVLEYLVARSHELSRPTRH